LTTYQRFGANKSAISPVFFFLFGFRRSNLITGLSGWRTTDLPFACFFVFVFVFCCYKTRKSLLRLPSWARSKTSGSISTLTAWLFLRFASLDLRKSRTSRILSHRIASRDPPRQHEHSRHSHASRHSATRTHDPRNFYSRPHVVFPPLERRNRQRGPVAFTIQTAQGARLPGALLLCLFWVVPSFAMGGQRPGRYAHAYENIPRIMHADFFYVQLLLALAVAVFVLL